jgi:hypothetical protein
MAEKKPLTHIAYARKRETRTAFRWIEIGTARVESDTESGHHVYVDRLPIGGFTGHIYLSPIGVKPDELETQPHPPGQPSQEDDF